MKYNDYLYETFPFADQNKGISLFTLRCENCYISLLGNSVRGCYENDDVKKHRKHHGEGLVDGT